MSVKYRMGIDSGDDAIVLTDSCVVPILAEAPTAWPPGSSGDQFSQTVVVGYRTLGALATFFESGDAPVHITSANANAFSVGLTGATNPAFNVDTSTASQAAGITVIGAVAAGTVAIAVTSSGSDASLSLAAKGTGTVTLASPVALTSTSVTLSTAGAAYAVQGTTVASVADTASGAITVKANVGRGTGAVGGFIFQVPVTTGSGTTAQTLTTVLTLDATTLVRASFAGVVSFTQGLSVTNGKTIQCGVSTTAGASINFGNAGTAPSAPADGDAWIESNTLKLRLNGATVTVTTS